MVEGKKRINPFVEKKPQNEVNWLGFHAKSIDLNILHQSPKNNFLSKLTLANTCKTLVRQCESDLQEWKKITTANLRRLRNGGWRRRSPSDWQ